MGKTKVSGIYVKNPYTGSDFELEFMKDTDKTQKAFMKALSMCDRAYKVKRVKL